MKSIPKGHNLENQLGFDHIGDKYDDFLKQDDKIEDSESENNNGYIITNN